MKKFRLELPGDYFKKLADAYEGEADSLLQHLSHPTVGAVARVERDLVELMGIQRLEDAKSTMFGAPVLPASATGKLLITREASKELFAVAVRAEATGMAEVAMAFPTADALAEYSARTGVPPTQIQLYVVSLTRLEQLAMSTYGEDDSGYAPLPQLEELFIDATRKDASDIHLKVGDRPRFRIYGQAIAQSYEPVTQEWLERQCRRITSDEFVEYVLRYFNADQAWQVGSTIFRLNFGVDSNGMTLAARRLAEDIPSMDRLNLPSAVRNFTTLERGLVLVTGPTGSGKSTTLAAMLNHIAQTRPGHIITLEDPIEYRLTGREATISQRERFKHFETYPDALRQALRQDPDIILVGEIRDRDTAETVFHAAETGHLVFGTIHTHNAASTVDRLIHLFPAEAQDGIRQQLAYILAGIVSQTLLRRKDGKGRVAAMEVLVNTPAIRNLISTPQSIRMIPSTLETSRDAGMQRLEQVLATLVRQNTVEYQEAYFKAIDKSRFEEFYKRS